MEYFSIDTRDGDFPISSRVVISLHGNTFSVEARGLDGEVVMAAPSAATTKALLARIFANNVPHEWGIRGEWTTVTIL